MSAIFREPLFYIFFVYGVSFLLMAAVVVKGIKSATSISLVTSYYALAGFGFTHGLTEMVDWARFIVKTTGNGEILLLKYASQCLLIVSFVVLLQFGVNLATYRSERFRPLRLAPAVLFVLYVVAMGVTRTTDIAQAGLIARYTFGFAGALVSSVALCALANAMKDVVSSQVTQGLFATATGFGVYAVVGGLIVTPLFGFPIQLFRAACAVTIAISSFYILGVFKAEDRIEVALVDEPVKA